MPQDRHGFVKYPVKMLLLHGLSVQIVSSFPIITKYKMQEVEKTFIVGKALKMTKKKPLLDQVRKKKDDNNGTFYWLPRKTEKML